MDIDEDFRSVGDELPDPGIERGQDPEFAQAELAQAGIVRQLVFDTGACLKQAAATGRARTSICGKTNLWS